MELSNIKALARDIEIKHPATGERLGLRITLLPDSHDKVRKVQRANLNRQLSGKKLKLTAAQLEENNFDMMVAAVDGWDWYGEGVTFKGEIPEFSEENVRKVLSEIPWIKDQLRQEFDEAESFFAS